MSDEDSTTARDATMKSLLSSGGAGVSSSNVSSTSATATTSRGPLTSPVQFPDSPSTNFFAQFPQSFQQSIQQRKAQKRKLTADLLEQHNRALERDAAASSSSSSSSSATAAAASSPHAHTSPSLDAGKQKPKPEKVPMIISGPIKVGKWLKWFF